VEGGGGDGTFASGVLQTLRKSFPEVFSRTRYVIDEISSSAGSLACDRLTEFHNRVELGKLDEVEVDCGIIFSNELLDAFPVHRVTMRDGKLNEFYVDVTSEGKFEWILGAPSTPQLADHLTKAGAVLGEGQVAEISFEIGKWLKKVGEKLGRGYLITVDYGAEAEDLYSSPERHQGTLRGFYRHQIVSDVLDRPGEQDLTTTVDWSLVRRAGLALGLEVVEFERQDKFLLAAGLLEQLESESPACESEAARLRLRTTAREMILPGGMASSFQVLVQRKT
jgi:SAM-dependent MidA family methyltransferase